MDAIKDIGLGGSIGFLVGIALVSWVEPTTSGGVGLLLVLGVLVGIVVGGIWTATHQPSEENHVQKSSQDAANQRSPEAITAGIGKSHDVALRPLKGEVDPQAVKVDPSNSDYTVPRTYGVYRIVVLKPGDASRTIRYGNYPQRLKELEREYESVELIALYCDRDLAVQRAKREKDTA